MKTGGVYGNGRSTVHYSTVGARIVEHIFVGDVLRKVSRLGLTDVEILRPEFDAHGYGDNSGAAARLPASSSSVGSK